MGSTRASSSAIRAALSRSRSEDDPVFLEAKQALHALATAPPISADRRARLASLLYPEGIGR